MHNRPTWYPIGVTQSCFKAGFPPFSCHVKFLRTRGVFFRLFQPNPFGNADGMERHSGKAPIDRRARGYASCLAIKRYRRTYVVIYLFWRGKRKDLILSVPAAGSIIPLSLYYHLVTRAKWRSMIVNHVLNGSDVFLGLLKRRGLLRSRISIH